MLNIASFIDQNRIMDLESTDKNTALESLVSCFPENYGVSKEQFFEKIVEREQDCSTGLGMGIAIPHARLPQIKENFIIVGHSRIGIDFDSPDGAPVHLIFMIAVSSNQAQYLQIISRISWLVRNEDLRSQLFRASEPQLLFELLSQH